MNQFSVRRTHGKRHIRVFASASMVLIICVLQGLYAAPARADGDQVHQYFTGCQKIWNWTKYGAETRLAHHYEVVTTNPRILVLDGLHVTSSSLGCDNTSGRVSAARTHVSFEYHFAVNGRSSCSFTISLPSNVTCSDGNPSEIMLKVDRYCSNTSICDISMGHNEFVVPYGTSLVKGNVYTRTAINLVRSDGGAHSYQFSRVHAD